MNNKIVLFGVLLTAFLIPNGAAYANIFTDAASQAFGDIMEFHKGSDDTEVNVVVETKEPKIELAVIRESFRQVTAYNVGDIYQTDDTPCIGAYTKVNLCDEIAKGTRVCAANFVPKQTMLRIFTKDGQSFECVVWDRMHSRFSTRVDIAMGPSEKSQAKQFGRQTLKVQILEEDTNVVSI